MENKENVGNEKDGRGHRLNIGKKIAKIEHGPESRVKIEDLKAG